MSIFVVSISQFVFLENERLGLIDRQLETIASSLIASGLSADMINSLETTQDLVNDLLGEERVDHIINLYNSKGTILARNFTAQQLELPFINGQSYDNFEIKNQQIRTLTIPHGKLVVQVGTILNPTLMSRWSFLSSRFFLFTISILSFLALGAYAGSLILFHPLKKLSEELRGMSRQLERKLGQPLSQFIVGKQLKQITLKAEKGDEFQQLCVEMENFLNSLEKYTLSFHSQMGLLTHELKTPLTVVNNSIEEIEVLSVDQKVQRETRIVKAEINRLTKMINEFLSWSVLTSNPTAPHEIHAIYLDTFLTGLISKLNPVFDHRIGLQIDADPLIFAQPEHVEQLATNLIVNGLKYGRSGEKVLVVLEANRLIFKDKGEGIPKDVMDQIGSPFNRGAKQFHALSGSGLGLAWVYAICEKYRWEIQFERSHDQFLISVIFKK